MKNNSIILFFTAFFLLCCLPFLSSCKGEKAAPSAAEELTLVENFRLSQMKDGEKKWDLSCRTSLMNEAGGTLKCTGPVILLYKEEKLSARITGENGILNMREKKSYIKTGVKVESLTENLRLYSNDLFFDSEKSRIWSYNGVRVVRNNIETKARGFQAKPDLSKINFMSHETKKI